jgi:hypothetical protein
MDEPILLAIQKKAGFKTYTTEVLTLPLSV